MNDFTLYTPTQVVFGRDAAAQTGALVARFGGTKALVHYGGGSAVRSGLLGRVLASLDAAGVAHVSLGGVVPNPHLSLVREAAALARREGCDFILAVGGGSVIDSAKAVAYALAYDGDVWDFYCGKARPEKAVPAGCVLTLAATGSEMSDSSVITNDEKSEWEKRGCNSDVCRLRFAVMDPALTATLPAWQTFSGVADILSHTLERYFSGPETVEPTDSLAEALLRSVMAAARVLVQTPDDYEARATVLWAGSLSHNGLMGCGRGVPGGKVGDWACHQLEHELSGMFDVTHGAGLAALYGAWARYVMDAGFSRFARLARNVLGVVEPDDEKAALEGVARYEAFLREIGMPTNLRALGLELTDAQLDALAYNCSFRETRTIGSFKKLGREDMRKIYEAAR